MSVKHSKSNDQVLRRAFDAVYEFDGARFGKQVQSNVNKLDPRYVSAALIITGFVILGFVVLYVVQSAVQWAARPTFEQRLAAPYQLDARPIAELDTTVGSLLQGSYGEFVIAGSEVNSLVGRCLQSASETGCTLTYAPLYVETAQYTNTSGSVSLIAAQYAAGIEASEVNYDLYRFARSSGRIGNFAFLPDLPVNYFYSSTREGYTFTWSHGQWIYSVSSANLETLSQFVSTFAY